MRKDEFISIFKDTIQTDDDISVDTLLADIEDWDSMAMMATIAWFDVNFGVKVTFGDLRALRNVGDVAGLVPGLEQ